MEAMDDMDEYVRKAGAMNTVVAGHGKLSGYNTDIPAALDAIDKALAESALKGLEGEKCLLLGAGGAGRAIALGIKDRGGQITITDGIAGKAEQLAEELGARSAPWEKREDIECSVILNATPVGMHPNADASPVSRRALERAKLVFDAVYNPPVTKFLSEAKELGIPTASGLDMFVNQAALQFKLWTGEEAPAELMREKIVERLGEG
jgi:3-dehydroquinate dehydratase/shikimate dehydrogenase